MIEKEVICISLMDLKVDRKLIKVNRNVIAKVQMNGKQSEAFEMKIGVKQGNRISPLLFIIVMDRLVNNTKKNTKNSRI